MHEIEPTKQTAFIEKATGLRSSDALAQATMRLRQCLYSGRYDPIPEDAGFAEFEELLHYISLIQKHVVFITRGEISEPLPFKGYTGNILKELQTNLQQVVVKARCLTVGDFSSDAGNMGEISEALDIMGSALQSALSRLERQKADLTELSHNLQREVEARIQVEENLRLEQIRLQKLASTDSLTGLANRRYFLQIAVREVERIRRTGNRACLAMLDIDHFKALNDSRGHNAGDRALHQIAQTISAIIRPYDLVGRYGGDEFIFLFPETGKEVASTILERLRESVEQARIEVEKDLCCITVSIGLTEIDSQTDSSDSSLDQAITRADEALYKAKGNSRNHICVV